MPVLIALVYRISPEKKGIPIDFEQKFGADWANDVSPLKSSCVQ